MGHRLMNPLLMRTYDGTNWEVEYTSTNEGLWLSRGWDELATELKISLEDVVLFNYYGGVQFEIVLYVLSGIEIVRNRRRPTSVPCNFVRPILLIESLRMLILPKYFGQMFGASVPNPLTLVAIDQTEWTVHWSKIYGRMYFDQGWMSIVRNFDLTLGDFVFFRYDGTSRMTFNMVGDNHSKLVTTRHCPNWLVLPVNVNETTLWISTVSKACVERQQALYVPAKVVKMYLSHKKIEVIVPSGQKQSWTLIWNKDRRNRCDIGEGWYSFVKDYELKIGQKVRFYLANNEDIIRLEVTTAVSDDTSI